VKPKHTDALRTYTKQPPTRWRSQFLIFNSINTLPTRFHVATTRFHVATTRCGAPCRPLVARGKKSSEAFCSTVKKSLEFALFEKEQLCFLFFCNKYVDFPVFIRFRTFYSESYDFLKFCPHKLSNFFKTSYSYVNLFQLHCL